MRALLRLSLAAFALGTAAGPFQFLEPTIRFSDADTRALDERAIVARILPAEGHELALLVAASLNAGPDALVRSVRHIAALETNDLVPEVGRFSARPALADLEALTLDADDREDIRKCSPEHCGLRLQPEEIGQLKRSDDIDTMFRRVVFDRAVAYMRRGGQDTPGQFSILLNHAPYIEARMPALARYLQRYPSTRLPGVESFLYWSKAKYASKPMITVTHVIMLTSLRGADAPEVLIASREIFSTRYTTGSFVTMMLFRNPAAPSQHYLVYINRTAIDGFGGLLRPFIEHRIKTEAVRIFESRRVRIEREAVPRQAMR